MTPPARPTTDGLIDVASADPAEFVRTARAVLAGHRYLRRGWQERFACPQARSLGALLTRRARAVLGLLGEGWGERAAAARHFSATPRRAAGFRT